MPRLRLAVPALAVGALVLAGCTGGAGTTTTTTVAQSSSGMTTTTAGSSGPSTAGAAALQQAYIDVVRKVKPSVVQITDSVGLGSGVIYDSKGDIVTNDHVVLGAHGFKVQLPTGGGQLSATLVGSYPHDDLAVLRVNGAKDLHPASFGDSSRLQVGEIVLAIGNPLGYESSVTNGIVSATGRTVVEPQGNGSPNGTISNAIQTSAAINPGNSGGALVDLAGQVVGIPTLAAVDPQIGGAAAGIGFAIPSNTVKDIAGQLIAHGHVVNSHNADLGICAFPVSNGLGQPAGVGIQSLVSRSAAGKAGVKPGDVITAINGTQITNLSDLQKVLGGLEPGQTVQVTIVRLDGSQATVPVTLGTLPSNAGTC
ncbi:MAG: S1C family serine protease [Acidimicrobiales bacterium]